MTKTTVTNTSSKTLRLSWIPPHGKKLAPSERVELPGDIVWYFVTFGHINRRKYNAMQNCIAKSLVRVEVTTE